MYIHVPQKLTLMTFSVLSSVFALLLLGGMFGVVLFAGLIEHYIHCLRKGA